MNAKAVGMRLQNLRRDRSREEVAAAVMVSESAIAMYERGERIPRDETKERLSKFYGVSVESLFFAD